MSSWKGILEEVTKGREIPSKGKSVVKYRYTIDKGHRLKRVRDPITHRFFDPKREEKYNNQMNTFFNRQQKAANSRRKHSEGSYDIISLIDHSTKGRCRDIETMKTKPRERYFTKQCDVDFDTQFGKNVKLSKYRKRGDYHIISNTFDDKGEGERRNNIYRQKVLLRKKVLSSKESNPVLHVNGNGKSIPQELARFGKGCGMDRSTRERFGEVRTKERRMIMEAKKDKKQINRMRRMRREEKNVGKMREDLEKTRMIRTRNRSNNLVENRDKDWVGRGYDLLSNQEYRGIKSMKPKYVPKLNGKKNLWDDLKKN